MFLLSKGAAEVVFASCSRNVGLGRVVARLKSVLGSIGLCLSPRRHYRFGLHGFNKFEIVFRVQNAFGLSWFEPT